MAAGAVAFAGADGASAAGAGEVGAADGVVGATDGVVGAAAATGCAVVGAAAGAAFCAYADWANGLAIRSAPPRTANAAT